MRFSQYFIIISYLIAGTGLLAVSLTNTISPVFLIGIGCVVLLSLFLSINGKPFNISGLIWNSLAVIILAAGLIDYLFISRSLIDVSLRFLTILMAAKLFDLKTNRDYAILYILTFFQLLAASASTVNISFLFVLSLYILTGIWALTIFNLKKDWEEKGTPHKEIARNILGPYFFIATAGLAGLSFIITLSLFFIIPRMEVGFFSRQTADVLKVSGFSEKVDIGELGPIKLDPTIVMRVEMHPSLPPPLLKGGLGGLHFRGVSFDTYNGAQWQQTIKETAPLRRGQDGIWRIAVRENWSKTESTPLTQTILLEPIETNVLFAASNATGVSGNFKSVMADRTGSLYLPAPSYSRIEYTAYSILPPPPKAVLPEEDYPEGVPSEYLHIPPGLERVSNLARDITALGKTPFKKAAAIEEYLIKNFHYTLNPHIPDRSIRGQEGSGKNPVEDFLFYTKEGYCEQYATTMAMMLRGAGVPSRLVTGFLPGEWNKFGSYFIIRQRDAHSWVEAYMSGSGWATFDPTPSTEAVGAMPPATSVITLYIDSLKWKWNRYIINYSFRDQMNFAKAVEGGSRSILSNLKWNAISSQVSAAGSRHKSLFIIIAVLIISALILAALIWRVRKPVEMTRRSKVPSFYKSMLRILAKKGKIKKAGKTALEFARDVDIKEAMTITDIYYNVRFGGYKPTDKENERIMTCLTAIKKMRTG